jgi:hypothetical protein
MACLTQDNGQPAGVGGEGNLPSKRPFKRVRHRTTNAKRLTVPTIGLDTN